MPQETTPIAVIVMGKKILQMGSLQLLLLPILEEQVKNLAVRIHNIQIPTRGYAPGAAKADLRKHLKQVPADTIFLLYNSDENVSEYQNLVAELKDLAAHINLIISDTIDNEADVHRQDLVQFWRKIHPEIPIKPRPTAPKASAAPAGGDRTVHLPPIHTPREPRPWVGRSED